MASTEPEPSYRPFNARRRLALGAMAISTAVGIVLMLIYRPGAPKVFRHLQADAPACTASSPEQCVGGKAEVILIRPASAAASAGP